jgi:soluble lytic murein transglycosylase-like protein
LSDFQPLGSLHTAQPVPHEANARESIARAANRTGVNFDYLLAQAKIESGLNPQARAGTSSAAGLYQFTRSTWLQTLEQHGAEHGLGWAGAAIEG